MSLTILLAHTGAQLQVDPRSLNSLDSLKSWIGSNSSIPAARQILMTGRGKPVKLQSLLTEKEIFVYDRELLSPRPPGQISNQPKRPAPTPYLPQEAPDVLADQTSLTAWQQLFQERRTWAVQTVKKSREMLQQTSTYAAESQVIKRATIIAAANPKQHIDSLQQKYQDAERWVESIIQDQVKLITQADKVSSASSRITTHNTLVKIIAGTNTPSTSGKGTFESMLDQAVLEGSKRKSSKAVATLRQKLEDVQSIYDDVLHDGDDLAKQAELRLGALTQDITKAVDDFANDLDICVRQISADAENTMRATQDPRSVAAISKTALLHTKKFLPTLYDITLDIGELLRRTVDRRNSIEDMALHFLQRTASVESSLSTVRNRLQSIDLEIDDDAALETLGRVVQYPLIYGSLLVEVVRRLEWNEKMLGNTSTLAEELATYKEDEEKRRRKWQKTVEGFLVPDSLSHRARGVAINLTGQEEKWPQLDRNDIQVFIQELENVGGFEETIREMNEWVKALDVPTKAQAKKSNAFRNGAMNESGFGRNSLLLRGDDDLVTSLQSDKIKLEDRLKGSESRIRKLEDLLHRSSQMSRPFATSPGPPNGLPQAAPMERTRSGGAIGYAISPRLNDSPSRRSSMTSHRLSLNQALEDDGLLQKVLQLETDLANERKRATQFEESVGKQVRIEDELRRQVEDAEMIKKDLMENFQAQQKDFEAERKLLDDELRQHKLRIEEMEEEYERMLGSHDNTRGAYSESIKEHEAAVETMRAASRKEIQQANDRIGDLQSINVNLHTRLELLEQENSRQGFVINDLEHDLKKYKENQIQEHKILVAIHQSFDPETPIPNESLDLVQRLEILIQNAYEQQIEMRQATDSIKGQNEALEKRLRDREAQVEQLHQDLAVKDKDLASVVEKSATQGAETRALEQELTQEREILASLRAQLPGSDLIKSQLVVAEKRAESLSLQLAAAQASSSHSDSELMKHVKAVDALQASYDSVNTRLDDRARRAAEVSLMLFLQTSRLLQVLEDIGFVVSREEEAMVVQRVTRTNSANQTILDPNQSMVRSISNPIVGQRVMNEVPPESLHWAMAEDATVEKRFFEDFIRDSKAFNLDVFCEAVLKRVKDTEHFARKWQREARTYRDKYRVSQFEVQQKIAFRAFKEGDLALFLPTRGQSTQRSWAAFNIGAPHYFLREQDKHDLTKKQWLVARIIKVEERVVDMSKSMNSRIASGSSEDGQSFEDDNPFGLSDGLRWYYLDAEEERTGAPIAPGPAKTTVASAQIDAAGSIERKPNPEQGVAARVLTRSLDSRRSSANSKRSFNGMVTSPHPPAGTTEVNPAPAAVAGGGTVQGLLVPDHVHATKSTPDETILASGPSSPLRSPQLSPSKNNKAWESLFSINVGSGSPVKKK